MFFQASVSRRGGEGGSAFGRRRGLPLEGVWLWREGGLHGGGVCMEGVCMEGVCMEGGLRDTVKR